MKKKEGKTEKRKELVKRRIPAAGETSIAMARKKKLFFEKEMEYNEVTYLYQRPKPSHNFYKAQ